MPVRERSKVQALPRLASHQVVSHRAAARVRRAHLDIPRSYLSRGFGRFVGEKFGELFGEAVGGATS